MRDTIDYNPPTAKPSEAYRELREELLGTPQTSDDWVLATRQYDEDGFTMYYTGFFSPLRGEFLAIDIDDKRPSFAVLWDLLIDAILNPEEGEPGRPTRLIVDRLSLAKKWQKRCDKIGVECVYDSEFEVSDDWFDLLREMVRRRNTRSKSMRKPLPMPRPYLAAKANGCWDIPATHMDHRLGDSTSIDGDFGIGRRVRNDSSARLEGRTTEARAPSPDASQSHVVSGDAQ